MLTSSPMPLPSLLPSPLPPPLPPPPLSAWGNTWRYLLAGVVGLTTWLIVLAEASSTALPLDDYTGLLGLLDLIVGIAAMVAMGFRRRAPLAVAVIITIATGVSGFAIGAWCIATVSLATRRRWRDVAIIAVLTTAAMFASEMLWRPTRPTSSDDVPWWAILLFGALVVAVLVSIGFYIGARRDLVASLQERVANAEREQALHVDQARANERNRIAREMHDVMAHRVSLVAMHSGALVYRQDLTREETAATASIIQDNAHLALSELREVLGVLRDGPAGEGGSGSAGPERPQPTLADLDELIAEARDNGMEVLLARHVNDLWAVPDSLGRHAYRIVQEALTNARKHAPSSPVSVVVNGSPGQRVDLEIRNRMAPQDPKMNGHEAATTEVAAAPTAGMGLLGLRERATLCGGELTHGPTSQGDFVVQAWLPWPA